MIFQFGWDYGKTKNTQQFFRRNTTPKNEYICVKLWSQISQILDGFPGCLIFFQQTDLFKSRLKWCHNHKQDEGGRHDDVDDAVDNVDKNTERGAGRVSLQFLIVGVDHTPSGHLPHAGWGGVAGVDALASLGVRGAGDAWQQQVGKEVESNKPHNQPVSLRSGQWQ